MHREIRNVRNFGVHARGLDSFKNRVADVLAGGVWLAALAGLIDKLLKVFIVIVVIPWPFTKLIHKGETLLRETLQVCHVSRVPVCRIAPPLDLWQNGVDVAAHTQVLIALGQYLDGLLPKRSRGSMPISGSLPNPRSPCRRS
jgi:hypothetical protein